MKRWKVEYKPEWIAYMQTKERKRLHKLIAKKLIHRKAYDYWSKKDTLRLYILHQGGISISKLAIMFNRSEGAIRSRLAHIETGNVDIF